MEHSRFDDLVKALGGATTRRAALKAAGAMALGLVGWAVAESDEASARSCRSGAEICRKDGDCCSGVCNPADSSGRRRCQCEAGLTACNGRCLNTGSDPKNCGGCGVTCPSTPCQIGVCAAGVCGLAPNPASVGRPCDDGNPCTTGDVCQANGTCAGTPKVCPSDSCNDGACDPASGNCVKRPKADGVACNADNSACTDDTCRAGVCTAGAPLDCSSLSDQCGDGVCDPVSGQCNRVPKANGTACDDGNACTQSSVCQDGICTGSNPVVCAAPDQCHEAGVCNPTTGACEYVAKADGSVCNADNSACTNDTCQAGACVAGPPKDCASAGDQCNQGVCNPTTGECIQQPRIDGTACVVDGSVCTENDTCQAGVCTPGAAKACPDRGPCFDGGTCAPATGECIYVPSAATTACAPEDENCFGGFCCPADRACQTADGPICCGDGQHCSSVEIVDGVTYGICCDAAATACLLPEFELTCCPSGQTCQSVDLDPTYNFGICCDAAATACVTFGSGPHPVCCPSGQACAPLDLGDSLGFTPGVCCAPGAVACPEIRVIDGQRTVGTCCESGVPCRTVSTQFGDLYACCPDESQIIFDPQTTIVSCCADPRPGPNGTTICCTGDDPAGSQYCCEAEEEFCRVTTFSGLTPTVTNTCCAAGQSCQTGTVNNFPISSCCDSGTEFCPTISVSGGVSIETPCCAHGETCQSVDINGATVHGCCDNELCPVFSFSGDAATVDVVCCTAGTVCSTGDFLGATASQCCEEGAAVLVNPTTKQISCCEVGQSVCNAAAPFGFSDLSPVCCDNCQTASNGVSICCGAGETAHVGSAGYVCCPAGQSVCSEVGPLGGSPLSEICCDNCQSPGVGVKICCPEGEAAFFVVGGIVCAALDACLVPGPFGGNYPEECPEGTSCSVIEIGGIAFTGLCCPEGESGIYAVPPPPNPFFPIPAESGLLCCPDDQICGFSGDVGTCCPAGTVCSPQGCVIAEDFCPVFDGASVTLTACPEGTICNVLYSLANLSLVGACCGPSETFLIDEDGVPICCDQANICVRYDVENPLSIPTATCCAGNQTCQNGSCVSNG